MVTEAGSQPASSPMERVKWRCVCDPMLYCSGVPDWETPPMEKPIPNAKEGDPPDYYGGKCKLNPETCGKVLFASEVNVEQECLVHETYVHKVEEPPAEEKEKVRKPKLTKKKASPEQAAML